MRFLFLVLALTLPSPALASKAKKRKALWPAPASEEVESGEAGDPSNEDPDSPDEAALAEATERQAELPALQPEEGSLWDYIEQLEGAVPDTEAVEDSEELEEARVSEEAFTGGPPESPPLSFYQDPLKALGDDPLHLSAIDPSEFDIPIVVNDDVIRWMEYFTGSGRRYYEKWLARSTRFRPIMYKKLEAAGLPRDLVYLSMIESGYATHAYSRAAAVGLWQFITPTAREHELRVDWWVDERRDPEMATDAAIWFLGDLNKQFGHWYLAWAAYNGGPSRVAKAVKRHGTSDFWTLVEKNSFPSETDNYVPKLLAAAIIGKHPERYGFSNIQFQEELTYDTVEVGPSIGLDVLARCAGVKQEELQALNPHLRRWALPPSPEKQVLRVPKGAGLSFLAALDKVPESERITFERHKVRKGETLGVIAKHYGVSMDAIQSTNRIQNANRIYVGMELVIPSKNAEFPPGALASMAEGAATKPAPKKATYHTIRKGESLSRIAAEYGVSQSDLMSWNGISNPNRIQAGQKLKLYPSSSAKQAPSTAGWTTYTVRKGDNLGTIASKNGCSVSELKSWNGIKGSTIHPGQKLKIRKR